ncbi:hypothetical protein RchiOBHm_Chr4g0437691 [Rosa chinensis]|uniref:Uncharacterized protein n=1 Tax=Rosa chinensis TaxID=74649 RepID=A0A2P6R2C8_ROSCH|nr:hypothetical protein RchiOBHm_Chr4g0437691 [Rosa chinensis]
MYRKITVHHQNVYFNLGLKALYQSYICRIYEHQNVNTANLLDARALSMTALS